MKKYILMSIFVGVFVGVFDEVKAASMKSQIDAASKAKNNGGGGKPLQSSTDRAKAFVEKSISEGILYWKNKPYEEQVEKFKQVMNNKFDLEGIAKRVVGNFMWDEMDQVQRNKYLMTFHQMLLNRYSKKFNQYGGQNIAVTDAGESVKKFSLGVESEVLFPQIVVTSELQNEGTAPVKVEWYVAEKDGVFMVTDITLAGPSMVSTEQATFTAIQRNPANYMPAKAACKGVEKHRMKKCITDELFPKVMEYMLSTN